MNFSVIRVCGLLNIGLLPGFVGFDKGLGEYTQGFAGFGFVALVCCVLVLVSRSKVLLVLVLVAAMLVVRRCWPCCW